MPIDIESETEFNKWLTAIEFVDNEGKILQPTLTEDESDDPENDRSEGE